MAAAHASVGAASTPPTPGMIFNPAEVTRHGAAINPHPDTDITNGRIANNAHQRRKLRGAGFDDDGASAAIALRGVCASAAARGARESIMAEWRIGGSVVMEGVS